ncbi:hypothetical protein HDU76_001603, partial [Blyttiomyces sp. JEL0837]
VLENQTLQMKYDALLAKVKKRQVEGKNSVGATQSSVGTSVRDDFSEVDGSELSMN